MKKNKKGFTLIEVLAVIVVLGIILVIATTTVTKSINNSRNEAFITSFDNFTDEVKKRVVEYKINKNIQIECADKEHVRNGNWPLCSEEYELSSSDYDAAVIKLNKNYMIVLKAKGKFKNIDYNYDGENLFYKYIYPFDYDVDVNIYDDEMDLNQQFISEFNYNYKKDSLLTVISSNGKNVDFIKEYMNCDITELLEEYNKGKKEEK